MTTAANDDSAGPLGLRVLRGAAWIGIASWSSKVLALATAPLLTALVSPTQYGVAALATTMIGLGSQLALLGVDTGYARYWAGRAERVEAERFCWRVAIAGAVAMSVLGFAVWQGAVTSRVAAPAGLAIVVALTIVAQSIRQMAITRTRFRAAYGRLAVSNLLAAIIGAAGAVMLASYWRADAWAIAGAALLGIVAGIAILPLPSAGVLLDRSALDAQRKREILGLGAAGAVSGLMFWITSSTDRWFIATSRDEHEVGLYAFASSIGTVGLAVVSSLVTTWFPEVTRSQEERAPDLPALLGRQWARLVVLQLVVWLAVATAGADAVHLLSDPRFHDSARFVTWIAAGVFFYGVASIATTGLWVVRKLRPSAYWWIGGAIANLALNAALVPALGALGAAVSWTLTQAFLAIGILAASQRAYPLRIPWLRLAAACMPAALLAWPLSLPWSNEPLASIGLKLPVGALVAASMMSIVAPTWTARLARNVMTALERATGLEARRDRRHRDG